MRLEKYLSDCGIGTRSQCKAYIRQGVIQVNGETVKSGSVQVSQQDRILFKEEPLTLRQGLYLMFHKPAGCICATKDETRKTVLDYFPKELSKRLLIVGRLDKDTEGLLLLTDDGAFVHRLMSPKNHVNKTYYFRAYGCPVEDASLQVETGIDIGDQKPTKPGKLQIIDVYKECSGEAFAETEGGRTVTEGQLTISEGRYHQVKRMLHALGCEVFYLKRLSIGNLCLDEALEPGTYRALTPEEYQMLENEGRKQSCHFCQSV